MSAALPPNYFTRQGQGRTLAGLEGTVCSTYRISQFSEGGDNSLSLVLENLHHPETVQFFAIPDDQRPEFYRAMNVDPAKWQRELVDQVVHGYEDAGTLVAIATGLPIGHAAVARLRRLSSRAHPRLFNEQD